MNATTSSTPAKILLYSTAAVFLTLGMKAISDILTPVFFALFAFLIFSPLVRWLMRKKVPGKVSVLLVILLFIFVFFGTAILFVNSLLQISGRIPSYDSQLQSILNSISTYFPISGENVTSIVVLIFITTTFLLLDAAGAPEKAQSEDEDQPIHLLRFTEYSGSVVNYMLLRTEINLVGGIGVAILLLLGGIDFALLWGLLFFLFGYIPYLGFYLAAIPPMLLGLFEYGPMGALGVIVGISIINLLIENVIFPSIAGKGLKLSPSIVFLSLFYWSYVLGAAGALIAVPLTMAVKLVLESSRKTRTMAKLMESSETRNEDEEKIENSS